MASADKPHFLRPPPRHWINDNPYPGVPDVPSNPRSPSPTTSPAKLPLNGSWLARSKPGAPSPPHP